MNEILPFLNDLYLITLAIIMHPFVMLWFGVASNFLKTLIQLKKDTGKTVSFSQYWIGNKYQSIFSLIGAVVGYVMLSQTGQLNAIAAFAVGYMCNSIADVIGKRELTKLENTPTTPPKV